MSRIRFTVEDSKVSEILKELLNLGIEITDLEVNTSEYDKDLEAVKKYIHDSGYIPPGKDSKEYYWNPWKFPGIGQDPFYVKIGDEGFDYTGSTKMPDNVYQPQSTTDVKSPNWNPKLNISTGDTVETYSPKTLANPSSKLDKTISMKSVLDFPNYKEN